MGAVKHFLSNYGSNLKIALTLWPVASFLLTLPILAYLYHRDGRLRFATFVATYLTVLYGLGLVCFTLYPLPQGMAGPGITYGVEPNFNPFAFLGDIAQDGLRAVFQLVFNVVFFMPLGFIAGRLFRMRFWPTVLLGLAVSATIETAQLTGAFGLYPYAYRCFDVDDLVANTLGATLGWGCSLALSIAVGSGKLEKVPITDHPGFVRRCVALLLDLTLVGLVAFVPWTLVDLVSELVFGQAFTLPGDDPTETVNELVMASFAVAFLVVEVVVPWCCDGSTPGGAFVRMTCESYPRTTGYRVLFYIARTITLVLALGPTTFIAVPVLALFYLFACKTPYDYIP